MANQQPVQGKKSFESGPSGRAAALVEPPPLVAPQVIAQLERDIDRLREQVAATYKYGSPREALVGTTASDRRFRTMH